MRLATHYRQTYSTLIPHTHLTLPNWTLNSCGTHSAIFSELHCCSSLPLLLLASNYADPLKQWNKNYCNWLYCYYCHRKKLNSREMRSKPNDPNSTSKHVHFYCPVQFFSVSQQRSKKCSVQLPSNTREIYERYTW